MAIRAERKPESDPEKAEAEAAERATEGKKRKGGFAACFNPCANMTEGATREPRADAGGPPAHRESGRAARAASQGGGWR